MQGISEYGKIRRKILFEHLEKYRGTSDRSVAKILSRDYPAFFKDIESTRGIVRVYRGVSGKRIRESMKSNQFYKHEPT